MLFNQQPTDIPTNKQTCMHTAFTRAKPVLKPATYHQAGAPPDKFNNHAGGSLKIVLMSDKNKIPW